MGQLYLFLDPVTKGARYSRKVPMLGFQPGQSPALGFLTVITIGTLLLVLPETRTNGLMPFVDAFFTEINAACAADLLIVDMPMYITTFGQRCWWIIGCSPPTIRSCGGKTLKLFSRGEFGEVHLRVKYSLKLGTTRKKSVRKDSKMAEERCEPKILGGAPTAEGWFSKNMTSLWSSERKVTSGEL
ncbi:MAG: hypothetical protein V3U68_04300 [Bacteroidota bacterium]